MWVVTQCAILSSGRVDNQFVITEEPDVGDKLVKKLEQMAAMPNSLSADQDPATVRRPADHWNLPFELRMLEVALDEACSLMSVEVRGVVTSANLRMDVLQASAVGAPGM